MATMTTLLVATRKGLFAVERGPGGEPAIAATAFLGDNVTLAIADPRDGSWYAALNLGHFGVKLQRSDDHGTSWTEVAVPAFGPEHKVGTGDGKESGPATLSLLWSLACGGTDEPGRLWAGTIPGGLFRSDDRGASWTLVEALWNRPERLGWFGGGYDAPGIHSICVDPRDPAVLRIAISSGGVWETRDAGATWALRASGMFATYMPPERRDDPNIQDVHHMEQCAGAPDTLWVQHHNGVFRSTDGAASWHEIPEVPPSVFGFAVAVHPRDPDRAWFVPAVKDQRRYPVDAKLVVATTADGGRQFSLQTRGLPTGPSYDLVYRHGLAIDGSGEQLAFGSTTGGLWWSADGGEHWQALAARLPPIYAVSFVP